MAHATDGAGSIRLPAANCGLAGLKPTRALLPAGPMIGDMWGGMLSDGVVSRSVRDTAACIPLFWSADNMPIGSQFFARFGEDATLLQLFAQLEEANPWFDKLPEMTRNL